MLQEEKAQNRGEDQGAPHKEQTQSACQAPIGAIVQTLTISNVKADDWAEGEMGCDGQFSQNEQDG
jgi:hypothetical protein